MREHEDLYKIEGGALVKSTENKLEYTDKDGKRRVKTNPSVNDFAAVGIFPLSKEAKDAIDSGDDVRFIERNGKIYPIGSEVIK